MMDITIKTLDSQNHPFSVDDEITVKEFKDHIAPTVNITADIQRLIYCGRVLDDEKKLKDYDVSGKVIHLVQRPPPQAGSGGGNRTTTSSGSRQAPQPRAGGGARPFGFTTTSDPVWLGSMQYPSEMLDQLGMSQFSQHVSGSRLTIARKMLRIANNYLTSLETNEVTPPTNDGNGDESVFTPVLAAQLFVPTAYGGSLDQQTDISAAVTAALNSSNPFMVLNEQNRNASASSTPSTSTATSSAKPNEETKSATTTSATSNTNATQNTTATASTSGTSRAGATATPGATRAETQTSDSQNRRSNATSITYTSSLADVLESLGSLQRRFEPYLRRYEELARNDPQFVNDEERDSAQRLFDRVSAIMHALGHAYHAISDIICHFERPTPRPLLCRPTLMQHAVLQTGITFPVREITVTTNDDAASQTETPAAENASAATGRTAQVDLQQESNDSLISNASTVSVLDEVMDNVQSYEDFVSGGASNNLSHSGFRYMQPTDRNIDIVVAVPDDDSTGQLGMPSPEMLANLVNAVTDSVIQSTGGGNFGRHIVVNRDGGGLGGSGMQVRVINDSMGYGPATQSNSPNLVLNMGNNDDMGQFQNMINVIMTGAARNQTESDSSATTRRDIPPDAVSDNATDDSSTANTTSAETSVTGDSATGQSASGQNSQARGNTATLPTSSTQTPRTTARPHVAYQAQTHSLRGFDPYLHCNSHHVRSSRNANRRRNDGNSASNATNANNVSNANVPPPTNTNTAAPRSNAPPVMIDSSQISRMVMFRAMPSDSRTPAAATPSANRNVAVTDPVSNTPFTNNLSERAAPTENAATVEPENATDTPMDTFYDALADGVEPRARINSSSDGSNLTEGLTIPTIEENGEASSTSNVVEPVEIGSEPWHSSVPPEWVSVVSRDIVTQSQQPAQRPFSDAYLSSVPAKRRKLIQSNKLQGNSVSQAVSEGLYQAIVSSGLNNAAPVDAVISAAGADQPLQQAYREEFRQAVHSRSFDSKIFFPPPPP